MKVRVKETGEIAKLTGLEKKGFKEAIYRDRFGVAWLSEKEYEVIEDQSDDHFTVTVTPAIDRLEEYLKDYNRVKSAGDIAEEMIGDVGDIAKELQREAYIDFRKKWGVGGHSN